MKKRIILIIAIVIVLLIGIFCWFIINNNKIEEKALDLIDTHIKDIDNFVNKYKVMNKGILEVSANYKGAHGESYPAEFTYNYELADKLYMENEEYTYLDINESVFDMVNNITNIGELDVYKYNKKDVRNSVTIYYYDVEYINNIFNTNFKKVEIKVFTKGILKIVDYIEIDLDELKITIDNKELNIIYNNNDIDLVKNDSGYYLSINGKLKCNIFVNDDNSSFSIVLNNTVYYLEMSDDGLIIKFTSSAAIYNNIDIKVKYVDKELTKKKLADNFDDNPIIRYLSKSDLSLWR